MPMATDMREGQTTRSLTVAREPVGPKSIKALGSNGDMALMDAVKVIALCWVLLFLLSYSLKNHNV